MLVPKNTAFGFLNWAEPISQALIVNEIPGFSTILTVNGSTLFHVAASLAITIAKVVNSVGKLIELLIDMGALEFILFVFQAISATLAVIATVIETVVDFVAELVNFLKNMSITKLVEIAGNLISKIVSMNSTSKTTKKVDDFIMRPGHAPIEINPNDTLVGFKGAPPQGLSSSIGNVNININGYNRSPQELARAIQEKLAALGKPTMGVL